VRACVSVCLSDSICVLVCGISASVPLTTAYCACAAAQANGAARAPVARAVYTGRRMRCVRQAGVLFRCAQRGSGTPVQACCCVVDACYAHTPHSRRSRAHAVALCAAMCRCRAHVQCRSGMIAYSVTWPKQACRQCAGSKLSSKITVNPQYRLWEAGGREAPRVPWSCEQRERHRG